MTNWFRPVAPDNANAERPLWVRLAWFLGIALASGSVVVASAYILRGLLFL